jgi:hypothetical protein
MSVREWTSSPTKKLLPNFSTVNILGKRLVFPYTMYKRRYIFPRCMQCGQLTIRHSLVWNEAFGLAGKDYWYPHSRICITE